MFEFYTTEKHHGNMNLLLEGQNLFLWKTQTREKRRIRSERARKTEFHEPALKQGHRAVPRGRALSFCAEIKFVLARRLARKNILPDIPAEFSNVGLSEVTIDSTKCYELV